MKVEDSGMPDVQFWESFFDPFSILSKLQLTPNIEDVIEFGCGYGTFTIPAARKIKGTLYAIDIEQAMLDLTSSFAQGEKLLNVKCILRDFMSIGTGLADNIVDYALVFNILHTNKPVQLLKEAFRVLKVNGIVGIVHWNYDSTTPRGPAMNIRPKPEQCKEWAVQAGFTPGNEEIIDLPPYHYGMTLHKVEM
jgi:ubiquinone/menaquinone biosynthesis C-methylase UbiE